MNINSVKEISKSVQLSVHKYQNLDPIQDISLYRICQLSSIVCGTSKSLILFEDSSKEGFQAQVGISLVSNGLACFFKEQTFGSNSLISCEDITTLPLTEKIFREFSINEIKSFVGLPLLDKQGEWVGCLFVLGSNAISLEEKSTTALQLLGSEALIVIQERKLIAEFSTAEKFFNISNDLICIAGTDGYFKKVSPSFTHLLGWTNETLLSRSFFELIHPDDIKNSRRKLEKLKQGEISIEFSHRLNCQDGSYKSLDWIATPEPTSGNIYCIGRDTTDAKIKEQQLAKSEGRLRAFFENSQGLMCTHDLHGVFLSVNEAGAEKLGYTSEQMVGRSLYDIVPEHRHPLIDQYLLVVKSEGKASGQMITSHKDGSLLIWMFNNVLESDPCGEGDYVIGNGIDISSRVKLEEELSQARVMLEETGKVARVGGWNLDLRAQELKWTPMTKIIHEVPDDFEPDATSAIDFYKEGKSREKITLALDRAISTGEGWDLELQLITAKGNELWVRSIGKVEFSEAKCVRVFGTFQDIDVQKKAQLELVKTKLKAEEASVAKSEFLANMSHEIRTPLNGVIGFTDLVLKTTLNETQHQYLSIVNQSGNALLSIINDILDFSKIEAGRLELDIDKCDLYEMCAQATDIITYQIQNKGLEMLLNIATDLPRFVNADSVRLKQILVNLLGNASKFTESGEIELKVETLEAEGDYHKIRFAVRDTGVGIKPEKQSKIFEAFSQEDSSTTKKYGGTGLGLTISNSLLRLMNSQLSLTSAPGEGSTFYFDVRLKTEQGEPINWFEMDRVKSVLIVDDNENNRLIVKQMLLLKNIQSTEASNGFEALQLLATGKHFDVILMDYHMPFMDGLETIRKIRETFSSWGEQEPIMLLHSSSDDQKIIESCRKLHVKHRLIKPIKIKDFYQTLSRLYTADAYKEMHSLAEQTQDSVKEFVVLVAEDNLVNMLLAKTIIKKIAPNATVIQTANGLEALEYCQKQLPDIILMDVQMPKMNGYEATKRIRMLEKDKHVPIIAFTAGNVKGERDKCLAAGMDDFVVKPVVQETIEMILNKWLDPDSTCMNSNDDEKSSEVDLHYNPAKLENYTDHDPEVLKEILIIVKSELRSSLVSLKEVIQEKELTQINEAGHKLYGTAISSGMKRLAKMANEFEHLDTYDMRQMNALYQDIEEEIGLVLKIIETRES
ncbi:PAS domain-containing hybrid sensor histidine kinase/response regulator [Algoriphagus antarcticus]|uniref:Sensory/regulatory protein RpfC n=1 Tax=Algoriphagus antarcticus TaxID=238540 RepID=A0A3E0EBU4_9BACT|nr:PAS domain-containing hybrid sensor histidine kinase/response regulator [Algoriphagus antarcticus]REG94699.1 PAS domain S-box-containing protein [Algoriphagus antarcticus]